MLKGIDPLLTPDLLKVLREMGHGDEIMLAGKLQPWANFLFGKGVISVELRR